MTWFLDIDGVITTAGRYKRYTKAGGSLEWDSIVDDPNLPLLFAPQAILVLQELVDEYSPEIVLSTSWRAHVDFDVLCEKVLRDAAGLRLNVVGKTPVFPPTPQAWGSPKPTPRGEEVQAYVLAHGIDVDSILVFEDEEDIRPYTQRQVKTCHYGTKSGLLPKHLRTARRILSRGQ